MSHPPELVLALRDACARLGKDAAEVRELLDAGEIALALEVLIDQFDALGAALPSGLARFGRIAQLRSDLEELQELLGEAGEHRFDPAVSALIASLDDALGGDEGAARAAAALLRRLFEPDQLPGLSLEDEVILGRIQELGALLWDEHPE